MHVSTSCGCAALATIAASARNGRAIETKSALPAASTSSAAARLLMRLLAITGTSPTARFTAAANRTQTAGRHELLYRRYRRLVPADADVERVDAVGCQRGREAQRLVLRGGIRHQVGAGDAEDHRKVAAGGGSDLAQHRARKVHPPFEVAAPEIIPTIGQRREKLVQQVAFRRHDLDGVESELARAERAAGEVADRLADLRLVQRVRRVRGEARRDRRRRDGLKSERGEKRVSSRRERAARRCARRLRARRRPPREGRRSLCGSLTKL